MSFPDYLNRIINSQLKNKQIETVRAEITKLITTNKPIKDKDKDVLDRTEIARKMEEIPKTMTNFFNVHSLHQQKDKKFEPRKTFSEMHINRLKKRLTLEQNKNCNEIPQPQQASMNEWRLQMLKHLKPPVKKAFFQPRPQIPTKQNQKNEAEKESNFQKRKFKFSKTQTASSPTLKKFERKQKIKQQMNGDKLRISSQRNIILIRPHPITDEQIEEKAISKFKKTAIKQKRVSRRSESQEDQLTVQRLANFTALLPFLGSQKAKVEARQQKKMKPIEEQIIIPKINEYNYQRKKKKTVQQVIQITGWDIHQD